MRSRLPSVTEILRYQVLRHILGSTKAGPRYCVTILSDTMGRAGLDHIHGQGKAFGFSNCSSAEPDARACPELITDCVSEGKKL